VILFPPNNGLLLGELQREMNYWKEDRKAETSEYDSRRAEKQQFKLQFLKQVLIFLIFIVTICGKNNVSIDQTTKLITIIYA
jgi:hypothetical protein